MKTILTLLTTLLISTTVSAWEYVQETDPLTDQDSSFIGAWDNQYQYVAIVRCNMGEFEVLFSMGGLGEGDTVEVMYRFDGGEVVEDDFITSISGDSAFVPPKDARSFLNQMLNNDELAIRAFGYRGEPKTSVFTLNGLAPLADRLQCL